MRKTINVWFGRPASIFTGNIYLERRLQQNEEHASGPRAVGGGPNLEDIIFAFLPTCKYHERGIILDDFASTGLLMHTWTDDEKMDCLRVTGIVDSTPIQFQLESKTDFV